MKKETNKTATIDDIYQLLVPFTITMTKVMSAMSKELSIIAEQAPLFAVQMKNIDKNLQIVEHIMNRDGIYKEKKGKE